MSELFKDLFIFEVANNHQGSVEHGLKIVKSCAEIAKKHGINAGVKFQYRDLDSFIHPEFKNRSDVKHIPRFLETRLSVEQFKELLDAASSEGLKTIVTPFDEVSVATCIEHDVDIIKIASCSATDWPLLEEITEAKKPIICSTGGLSIYDIDNLVSFFTHRNLDFALMHCVALYPTPSEAGNLNFLDKMKKRYPGIAIGYSGHEAPDNLDVVKVAVGKGAELLERHVGVPTEEITLNKYSMNSEKTAAWVAAALLAKSICGSSEKPVSDDEATSLCSLMRGVFATRKVTKGAEIKTEDVFFAMPCSEGQVTSGDFGRKRAKYIASKDYELNEAIYENSPEVDVNIVRSVIHEAKGMIYEAGIALGKDYQIELSHHYGLEKFRETGALIVNIINRAYCKKIIVVLPGQKHPVHWHKIKEETFQLLWGDLAVDLNGKVYNIEPGEKLLVEQGVKHSFLTKNGAIFEEVSTTHHIGDSCYEDPKIAELDPMQRKTVLEQW